MSSAELKLFVGDLVRLVCQREPVEADYIRAASLDWDRDAIRIDLLLSEENLLKWPLLKAHFTAFVRSALVTDRQRAAFLLRIGAPSMEGPTAPMAEMVTPPVAPKPLRQHGSGLAVIASKNFLPFAALTFESFHIHHPEMPGFLLLVDGTADDRDILPGCDVVLLSDLMLPDIGWYCCKYDANELCNALKPSFLKYLAQIVDTVIYLDSDIAVFERFTAMLEALDYADLVVTPHTIAPFPRTEQFGVHPNNADIFNAGLINAGAFGIRLTPCLPFLDFWEMCNLSVGAFFGSAGGQTDQQYFNWALILVSRHTVLRDTAYNVAYWNLHDRSFRHIEANGWEVDGKPLVFFHFSGYDVDDIFRLSKHDGRYSVYNMPSVARILAWYTETVKSMPAYRYRATAYGYDILANGVRVTALIRGILKKYETYAPRFDARSDEGAFALCTWLMTPLAAAGSTLPLIAAEIYDRRPDLHHGFPHAHSIAFPEGYWRWFCRHAGREYDIHPLIDRFRRALISDSMVGFAESVGAVLDAGQRKLRFLEADRHIGAATLRAAGHPDMAETLLSAQTEWFVFGDMSAVLAALHNRPELRRAFPDPFGASHTAFATWLRRHGAEEHNLSPRAIGDFQSREWESACARLFSYLCRREDLGDLARRQMLADAPDELLRELIRGSGEGMEYDLADVEVFRFLHTHQRERLVPIYLELPCIRRAARSARVPSAKLGFLPEYARGQPWAERGCRQHDMYFDLFDALLDDEMKQRSERHNAAGRHVFDTLRAGQASVAAGDAVLTAFGAARQRLLREPADAPAVAPAALPPRADWGVNIFGFFWAETGVGESARGLARAAALLREVSCVPLHTGHLRPQARLGDLFQRYEYMSDTNILVSYPHMHEDFFGILPREYLEGRRNIIHLAWEQHDWNPHWRQIYERYDEIWTISGFAAVPFRRMFGDRVRVVPNVLNFDDYPAFDGLRTRGDAGERFRFLFVFDANSSMERKNPEAVLEAFIAAFQNQPDAANVELYFKVGNLERPEHAARVAKLRRRAAASGLSVAFDGAQLSRAELMHLIALADCYVSLHRAEGFGYTMAEAMYYGVPVIASNYSGNLEYMDAENSLLVPCTEALVQEADGPFQRGSVWGEPSVPMAADMMRGVVRDRLAPRLMGERGRQTVIRKLSAAAVAETLRASLAPETVLASVPVVPPEMVTTSLSLGSAAFGEGWYGREEHRLGPFQWMGRSASLISPQPRRPVSLVTLRVRSCFGDQTPSLDVKVDGHQWLVSRRVAEAGVGWWIDIAPPSGTAEPVERMTIESDAFGSPVESGLADRRTLAIRVSEVLMTFVG